MGSDAAPARADFRFAAAAAEQVAGLKSMGDNAGVSVSLAIDDGALAVKGDPGKLRQVFANLIGNAIKFTAAGGTVFVDAECQSDGATTIFVRDTGVGMDADELEVALAPFGQVDGTRTRWREGTGLGLPIAKALIELHGGRLAINSVKSVGTEVRVELPSPLLVNFMQQDLGIQSARV